MRFFPKLSQQKWTKTRLITAGILIFALLGLSYLIFQRLMPAPAPNVGPTVVIVSPVNYQNIPMSVNAIGSLSAPEATMLKAQVAGVIANILVKNGQNVQKGELLVQLDNAENKALYAKAEAALIEAKTTYDRYQSLEKEDPEVLSKLQIDQVLSTYQQAQANLDAAAKQLQNMQITAPFAGTVGSTNLAIGSYVNQGDDIIAIVNRANLEIIYNLPESYYGQVKLGQKVSFTSDAYPGKTFTAIVDYVAPLVSQQNRAFNVRARISKDTQALSPGMLVNLTQILKEQNRILAVPAVSLVTAMSGYAVYTVQDGKVLSIPVQIGARSGDWVEITSGLSPGVEIITSGQEKVQPGSSVSIMSQGS